MTIAMLWMLGCASGPAGETGDLLESSLEAIEESVAAIGAAATAHHEGVLDTDDIDAIHDLETAWPDAFGAAEEGMHHALEDLAACGMMGDATSVDDVDALLEAMHEAITEHSSAMLDLDDADAAHAEEEAHRSALADDIGTLEGLHDAWHEAMDCSGVEHHDG